MPCKGVVLPSYIPVRRLALLPGGLVGVREVDRELLVRALALVGRQTIEDLGGDLVSRDLVVGDLGGEVAADHRPAGHRLERDRARGDLLVLHLAPLDLLAEQPLGLHVLWPGLELAGLVGGGHARPHLVGADGQAIQEPGDVAVGGHRRQLDAGLGHDSLADRLHRVDALLEVLGEPAGSQHVGKRDCVRDDGLVDVIDRRRDHWLVLDRRPHGIQRVGGRPIGDLRRGFHRWLALGPGGLRHGPRLDGPGLRRELHVGHGVSSKE